jgi:hypothetical protein
MPKPYRIFIGLLIIAALLTFFSLFFSNGIYLLIHDPKAMDFLAFYTGVHLLSQSPGELYNLHSQLVLQQQIDPITQTTAVFLPFLNPPFVAVIFWVLLPFGLQNAYAIWLSLNMLMLLTLCVLTYRQVKLKNWYLAVALILGIVTFIPVLTSILIGQLSLLLCLILLIAWIALKREKEFIGGLILSCMLIKPQFIILILLALIVQRRKKLFLGFLSGIAILFSISYLLVGWNGINNYVSLLNMSLHWDTGYGIDLMAQHSMQTMLLVIFHTQSLIRITFPWIISIMLIGILTLFVCAKKYKLNSAQFSLQFVVLIIATLLTSPHTHFHDLSMLVVVAIILLSLTSKLKSKQKKLFIIFVGAGYLLELAGYLLDVQTQTATRPLWIEISVGYMLIFWFVLVKALIKSNKLLKTEVKFARR